MISSPIILSLAALAAFSPYAVAQTPTNTTGAPPECVAAADSRLCGDFAGQMIDLRMARDVAGPFWNWNLTGVDSIGKLDAALVRMMIPGAQQDNGMYQYFGCPAWDGSGWRYRLTALCGYLTQQSNKCSGNSPTGLVCPDAWKLFQDSGMQAFTNTTKCPDAKLTQIRSLFAIVDKALPATTDENIKKCVTATFELNNCGFGTTQRDLNLATSYCATNNRTDPCCSMLNMNVLDLSNPTVTAPKSQPSASPSPTAAGSANTSASSSSSSAPSTAVIAGIAVGGAVVLAVAIVGGVVITRRRRAQRDLWNAHTNLVQQSKSTTPVYATGGSEFRGSPSRLSPSRQSAYSSQVPRQPTPTRQPSEYYNAPPKPHYTRNSPSDY
ncbi:uncharacterized protein SPPG_01084 [Spizellomyces punctatus DAOM BR117]|uniref:Transmembrane protein n=1 Tax=Spizellomyces punctatus (strain DAOM BR117) TaxID=645134 RepID=A0A0L0HRD5_SPIPD|nr:uncharacterized protein SPPG_01084 [Spizellomyces punctatus DAOM BR117]KND03608.1 hypothetical protein SPPG_01084 [Spizellomyces punctatus DAOM BR117]|eukprot:XP_016611647.1 hypothetical protein SPPG_01084 [Spizellomyces punctatus DAOM BR117]